MPTENYAEVTQSFRRRLGYILALRQGIRFSFAWNMLWAGAVVGLRAAFLVDRWWLLWGAVGLAAAVAAGVAIAIRKLPSPGVVRAVLDRHGALGGLLMAAGDTDIGSWTTRIEQVPAPSLAWRWRRPAMLWVASAAFLVAAFLTPDRAPSGSDATLQIGGDIRKLADQLQVLTQEQIVPPEKAQVLERDLERVRQEAQGKDPAKTMEATDHLAQSFRKEAAEAAESAIRQTAALSREQELAKALQKQGAGSGEQGAESDFTSGLPAPSSQLPASSAEAMQALAKMAEQSAEENQQLQVCLSEELKEAFRKGELSQSQLEELSKALSECKECELAKIARLVEARLVDADELDRCKAAGDCDAEDFAAFLARQQSSSDERPGLPGRGGTNRGPAPAAMTWTEGAKQDDAAFKAKVLAPGAAASLKGSRLTGISSGDPTSPGKPGGGSSGGALNAAQAGGGEARTQVILPEHERTVERYFERGKK
jgi:hypothetical protein